MPRSPRTAVLVSVATLMTLTVTGLTLAGCIAEPGAPESAEPMIGSVWVANEDGHTLTVIDAPSGTVRATVAGIPAPHNVHAGTDGSTMWVISGAGAVGALDTASMQLTDVAATGAHPAHVVGDADGNVYVTSAGDGALTRYDAALVLADSTTLAGAPHGLRLDADGELAVVANSERGTVDVVATASGELRDRVAVGPSSVQVAVRPDGGEAFVSVTGTSELVRVDLDKGRVTGRVSMPAAPAQILLMPDGEVLVANQGTQQRPGHSVSVVDPRSMRAVAEIRTGAGPHGLTVDPSGRRLWVSNSFDDTVTVVDLEARTADATVPVGDNPNGIAFSPQTAPEGIGGIDVHLPPKFAPDDGHAQTHLGHAQAGHTH